MTIIETEQAKHIGDATYDALLTVLDATGPYPLTRYDILQAIQNGVQAAFETILATNEIHE